MAEMLTREQILAIRNGLTLGDQEAAKAEAGADDELVAKRALYRRASKLGYVNGTSYEDFLDLIRLEDIKLAFSDETTAPLDSPPAP